MAVTLRFLLPPLGLRAQILGKFVFYDLATMALGFLQFLFEFFDVHLHLLVLFVAFCQLLPKPRDFFSEAVIAPNFDIRFM